MIHARRNINGLDKGGKMNFYKEESQHAKWNAQRNLAGRTHYVDDATLRFHHSRILTTKITDDGLIFSIIESCAADMNNTKRGFRFVTFDLCGNVIERAKLDGLVSSRRVAEKAMWKFLNEIDAKQITRDAIDRAEKYSLREFAELREKIAKLDEKAA